MELPLGVLGAGVQAPSVFSVPSHCGPASPRSSGRAWAQWLELAAREGGRFYPVLFCWETSHRALPSCMAPLLIPRKVITAGGSVLNYTPPPRDTCPLLQAAASRGRGIGQMEPCRYMASLGSLMRAVSPLLRQMPTDARVCQFACGSPSSSDPPVGDPASESWDPRSQAAGWLRTTEAPRPSACACLCFSRPTRCSSAGGSSPPRRRAAEDWCRRSSGRPRSARRSCCG